MFQDLKTKAWRRKLPLLTALLVAVLAVAVYLGPSLVSWAIGPSPFEQMEEEDPATLKGRYVESEVTTLMDYYAETIRKVSGRPEEVTARDYLMPVAVADNDVVYVGLRLSKDSLLSANAVVADTVRMLSDMDGSYVWDGSSVSVRGTFQQMDQETEKLYRDYLASEFGVDASLVSMDSWFLPLVLVDGQIGRANRGSLILFTSLALLALAVLFWNLHRLNSGSYQRQIRSYLAAQSDPELALESLARFYSDTQEEGRVRLGKDWLLYVSGAQAWVLRADDVAWAYQHTFRQKQGLWTLHEDTSVRVFSVSSGGDRFYQIPVFGESQAQELLERLFHTYPGLAVGYDLELQKAFSTDPAAFHAATLAARTGEEAREQPTETAPQEDTPEQDPPVEPNTNETDAPSSEKPESPCNDTAGAPAESEAPETTSPGEESGEGPADEESEKPKETTPSDDLTETIEEPEVTEENEETSPTDAEAEADEPTEPEAENPAQDAETSEEPLSAEEASTSPEEPEAEPKTCPEPQDSPDTPDGEELGEEK